MAAIKHVLPSVCLLLITVSVHKVSGNRQRQQTRSNLPTATLSTSEVNPADFQGFIPTTPSPENVNCHVEVSVLQEVGGQCVLFGRSQMWSCQSGVHVQLSPECERINRRRNRPQRRPNNQRP